MDVGDEKGKVLMRQPPKKRSKEIREMMKIEDEAGLATSTDQLTPTARKLKKLKEVYTSVATKFCPPQLISEKVAELDLRASRTIGLKLYRCCFCDRGFLIAKRALVHIVNTHEIGIDECVNFVNIEDKNAQTKDTSVCDICGYKTKKSGMYYVHFHKYFRHNVPLPKGWEPFRCDLCKKEFFTKFQLREHKLVHFDDHPFICETCGAKFKTRTAWNSHIFHKHNNEKKFKCPECPKCFKTMTKLKVHSRVHSGEKPFQCMRQGCLYRSTTRGNMKLHLSTKHKLQTSHVQELMEALRPSDQSTEDQQAVYVDVDQQGLHGNSVGEQQEAPVLPHEILVFSEGQDPHVNQNNDAETLNALETNQHSKVLNIVRDLQANDGTSDRNVNLIIQDINLLLNQRKQRENFTRLSSNGDSAESNMRAQHSKQMSDTRKYLDPNSKEARMFLKEALQHPEHSQLLKSAIYQNSGHFDTPEHKLATETMQQTQDLSSQFSESDNLVIDMQEDTESLKSHDLQTSIATTLQRLRNSYQYREVGASLPSEANVVELLHSISASGQEAGVDMQGGAPGLEATLGTAYQHRSSPPPSYQQAAQAMLPLPRGDTQLQPRPASLHECMGQPERPEQHMMATGVFTGMQPQPPPTQYHTDTNLYDNYYQDQYDIENY